MWNLMLLINFYLSCHKCLRPKEKREEKRDVSDKRKLDLRARKRISIRINREHSRRGQDIKEVMVLVIGFPAT